MDSRVGAEDFRNVLRHEMGHVLGLWHTDEEAEVLMNPYYDPDIYYDVMTSELDKEALLFIYDTDGFDVFNNIDPADLPDYYPSP